MQDMIVVLCIGGGVLTLLVVGLIIYLMVLSDRIKSLKDIASNHEKILSQSDDSLNLKIVLMVNLLAHKIGFTLKKDYFDFYNCVDYDNKCDRPTLTDKIISTEAALSKTVQYLDMLYNHLGLELKPETIEPEKIIKKEEPAKTTTGNNRKEK